MSRSTNRLEIGRGRSALAPRRARPLLVVGLQSIGDMYAINVPSDPPPPQLPENWPIPPPLPREPPFEPTTPEPEPPEPAIEPEPTPPELDARRDSAEPRTLSSQRTE